MAKTVTVGDEEFTDVELPRGKKPAPKPAPRRKPTTLAEPLPEDDELEPLNPQLIYREIAKAKQDFRAFLDQVGRSRELSIAWQQFETACLWVLQHVTRTQTQQRKR